MSLIKFGESILSKQSPRDRERRFKKGQCPIHGIPMSCQIDRLDEDNGWWCECPRKDCEIRGYHLDEEITIHLASDDWQAARRYHLAPEWEHLLTSKGPHHEH